MVRGVQASVDGDDGREVGAVVMELVDVLERVKELRDEFLDLDGSPKEWDEMIKEVMVQ